MAFNKTTGTVLKLCLIDMGYRIEWMADHFGVNRRTFSAYMNGTRKIPEELHNKVVDYLRQCDKKNYDRLYQHHSGQ